MQSDDDLLDSFANPTQRRGIGALGLMGKICGGNMPVTSDASYTDPLGELPPRPKTAAKQRKDDDEDFGDEELGDDMLPE